MYTRIKININIVCFLLSCFISSVALADIDIDEETIETEVQNLKNAEYNKVSLLKEECINIKTDPNHKLHKYSIYLNNIANHILSKNEDRDMFKDINPEDICILPTIGGDLKTMLSGLITIDIDLLLFPTITNDAVIAAVISHELVHSIFKHTENNNNIRLKLHVKAKKLSQIKKKLKEEAINLSVLSETGKIQNNEFETIISSLSNKVDELKKHERQTQLEYENHIKQVRETEIQADNEGFKLYLNAGFKPDIFRHFFFDVEPFELFSDFKFPPKTESAIPLSDDEYYLFKETFSLSGCIREGNKVAENIRETKNFLDRSIFMKSDFMNTIKYSPIYFFDQKTPDVHPTRCWRYWNIQTQLWWNTDEESLNFRKQNMENLPDSPFDELKESIKNR